MKRGNSGFYNGYWPIVARGPAPIASKGTFFAAVSFGGIDRSALPGVIGSHSESAVVEALTDRAQPSYIAAIGSRLVRIFQGN